mmetsp:Transcript_5342/g.15734  ORF Transcript_5342/g.15734 Transcript_5342/m.15734 type:complete len:346 (-) Transcript_5342:337-1374(-)
MDGGEADAGADARAGDGPAEEGHAGDGEGALRVPLRAAPRDRRPAAGHVARRPRLGDHGHRRPDRCRRLHGARRVDRWLPSRGPDPAGRRVPGGRQDDERGVPGRVRPRARPGVRSRHGVAFALDARGGGPARPLHGQAPPVHLPGPGGWHEGQRHREACLGEMGARRHRRREAREDPRQPAQTGDHPVRLRPPRSAPPDRLHGLRAGCAARGPLHQGHGHGQLLRHAHAEQAALPAQRRHAHGQEGRHPRRGGPAGQGGEDLGRRAEGARPRREGEGAVEPLRPARRRVAGGLHDARRGHRQLGRPHGERHLRGHDGEGRVRRRGRGRRLLRRERRAGHAAHGG